MLSQIMTKISGGVTFLGGVLIVFGLVNLGMTIKDGMQGGGGQLAGAIAHDRRRRYRHRSLRFPRQPGHQFRWLKEEMPDA